MKWIKIEDKQPVFGERVLTAHGKGTGWKQSIFVQIRQLKRITQDDGGVQYFWFDEQSNKEETDTTHWMKIPHHPE